MRYAPLIAALGAGEAQAHLVETGFGDFYDGVAHMVITPVDLLVVIALALLSGQRGTRAARWTMLALPVAWLAGGLIGARWPALGTLPLATTITFLAAGALVALNAKLPDAAVATLALAVGAVHGLVNGATMGPTGASGLALAGAVTVVFCLATILSAEVTALRAAWTRIAVRVGGSWIAAAGLLMVGWLARA